MTTEQIKLKAWASGFLAGEGCFSIHKKIYTGTTRYYYRPELQVQVRADDVGALLLLKEAIGSGGTIYSVKAQSATLTRGNSKPTCSCFWRNESDLKAVVRLIDEFPLRGKKQRDYEIWKKSVDIKYSCITQEEKRVLMSPLKNMCSAVKKFSLTSTGR